MRVKHLFLEGRALITSLLWIAFITSLMGHHFLTSWLPTVLNTNGVPLAHAVVAGSLIQGGGALGSLIVGRLLDRVGMISIVMAFIISIPFVVLIGAVAMPEYLLMTTVFISGMCLLGGQIGLNALARSCRCHGSSSAPQSRGRAARSRCSPCRQWSQESPHARRNQSCARAKCPGPRCGR